MNIEASIEIQKYNGRDVHTYNYDDWDRSDLVLSLDTKYEDLAVIRIGRNSYTVSVKSLKRGIQALELFE